MKFQELCLQYGENNLTREQLIQYIKLTETLHELELTFSDEKVEPSEEHRKFTNKCLTTEYQNLKIKYDILYFKWEQFSKCLNMGPEKFISMLDDLKEKLKSKGNEIAHLREKLKTSELDAKRYKNDGIQDRVKLQEVVVQLESTTKMRDNWKADCEDAQKCFQAERDKRWELEEEVKQLKNQVQSLLDALDEVCPKMKFDLSTYITSKKELDESVVKKLSKFQHPYIDILQRPGISCSNIYITFNDSEVPLFIDSVKNTLNKDDYALLETEVYYTIVNKRNGDYLYTIDKLTKNVKTLTHLKFIKLNNTDCKDCRCACSNKNCIKPIYTQIYFTIGAERILVDTVPFDVNYWHYNIGEDSTENRYVISRKDPMQKDLHNYTIDKYTLEVKVID